MSWRARLRPEVAALRAYAPEPDGEGARLDANECPFDLSAPERESLVEIAARLAFHRYPPAGVPALRRTFADYLGVDADWVTVANGSDELIPILCTVFGKSDARPSILIPTPTFSMYAICARPLGYEIHETPLGPRFELDPAAVGRAVAEHAPNLVFLASPNNPTGGLVSSAAVDAALAPGTSVVVVDEAYGQFAGRAASHRDRLGRDGDLALLFSLSKIGLAALRLGALVAEPALVAEVDKVRLPYNVDAFAAAAAICLLGEHRAAVEGRIEAVIRGRGELVAGLQGRSGVEVFESHANFVLIRVPDAPAVAAFLRSRGIVVRNLHKPGPLWGCLRITVGTPHENRALLEALEAYP